MKPPTWYFDETTIGVGLALSRLQPGLTWPGDDGKRSKAHLEVSPLPVKRGMQDEEWLPILGAASIPIITQDYSMTLERRRPAEFQLINDYACHVFAIKMRGKQTAWDIFRAIVIAWDRMQQLSTSVGPTTPGAWWLNRAGDIRKADGW